MTESLTRHKRMDALLSYNGNGSKGCRVVCLIENILMYFDGKLYMYP